MEEILAKGPFSDHGSQILIGGGNDSGVHFYFLASAYSANPAILDG